MTSCATGDSARAACWVFGRQIGSARISSFMPIPKPPLPLAIFHGLRQQMKKPAGQPKLLAGGLRGSARMQTD